jgi:hypothetical protein
MINRADPFIPPFPPTLELYLKNNLFLDIQIRESKKILAQGNNKEKIS